MNSSNINTTISYGQNQFFKILETIKKHKKIKEYMAIGYIQAKKKDDIPLFTKYPLKYIIIFRSGKLIDELISLLKKFNK